MRKPFPILIAALLLTFLTNTAWTRGPESQPSHAGKSIRLDSADPGSSSGSEILPDHLDSSSFIERSGQEEFQAKATRTPRPTGTPVPQPPPSDPETTNMMIGFSVIAALVVLLGVWVNRSSRS